MATIEKFEDLIVWQKARILCKKIYGCTNFEKFTRDFALKDQIRRSSGSVMDNIAEGFDRDGTKEFIQFLSYSKGSAAEVKSQLYRALDFGYISQEEFNTLYKLADEIGKMEGKLMTYLRKTKYRGVKFKVEEGGAYYGK